MILPQREIITNHAVNANDMTTPNPTKPATPPVLYIDQYGEMPLLVDYCTKQS